MLPRIGITMAPTQERETLRYAYVEKVLAAGGLPLLLPSVHPLYAGEIMETLDGLIISGGDDYPPQLCGMEGYADPTPRDQLELVLMKAAWKAHLPVLGICRGMQGMNIALGGTLKNINDPKHQQPEPRNKPFHTVELLGELKDLYSADTLQVNSLHHQAAAEIAPPLRLLAAAEDGVVEAIGACDRFFLGVQWHPEHLEGLEVFEALIKSAGANK